MSQKIIKKIVITGGPCAGKTTAMAQIKKVFSHLGYSLLFMPETATELISGGVAPWTMPSVLEYQSLQLSLQLKKEEIFTEAAQKLVNADKILIVFDRGTMDNKAYMTDEDFSCMLNAFSLTEQKLLASYDAVFHLVTAAKGARQFYTLDNNLTRTETPEQAAEVDTRLSRAWSNHPAFTIIDSCADFDAKINRLISEIASFLGEKL